VVDQGNPYQAAQPLPPFPAEPPRSFLVRFATAAAAAFCLVFACALSLQVRAGGIPHLDLVLPAIGVALAAVPAGLIAAAVVRRRPVLLILTAQALTISLLTVSFWVRA